MGKMLKLYQFRPMIFLSLSEKLPLGLSMFVLEFSQSINHLVVCILSVTLTHRREKARIFLIKVLVLCTFKEEQTGNLNHSVFFLGHLLFANC